MKTNHKTPEVSIIIPTYNREKTILRAVQSALKQTYSDREIIVIDDAGTDRTGEVLKPLIDRQVIHYIKLPENLGGSGARNKGIDHARGRFVAFLDSDDEWVPGKLEKQMEVIAQYPDTDVVFSQMKRIFPDKTTVFPAPIPDAAFDDPFTLLMRENKIGTPTAIVRLSKLKEINGFDASLPRLQDWDLFLRLSLVARFKMIPEPLCLVYLQDDSISRNSQALHQALTRIEEKFHDRILDMKPADRTAVYDNFGSLYYRAGMHKQALKNLRKSLSESFSVKSLAKYIALLLPGRDIWYEKLKKLNEKH